MCTSGRSPGEPRGGGVYGYPQISLRALWGSCLSCLLSLTFTLAVDVPLTTGADLSASLTRAVPPECSLARGERWTY